MGAITVKDHLKPLVLLSGNTSTTFWGKFTDLFNSSLLLNEQIPYIVSTNFYFYFLDLCVYYRSNISTK